jgi:hypothetical protein
MILHGPPGARMDARSRVGAREGYQRSLREG